MPNYVPYRPDVEIVEPDEAETHSKIISMMSEGMSLVREKTGHSVRISHGKTSGFLKGTLTVSAGLPVELAQGLFAQPGTYEVIARFATAPGEITDDSKVTSARGLSLKVLGVTGPKLAEATDNTQDFVLDTGTEFNAGNAKEFSLAFQPNAKLAPKLSDSVKGAVASVAEATNAALNSVGLNSQKLDFFGHKQKNPMGEPFFSQTPQRHGDYIAKLGIFPDTPYMKQLEGESYDPETYDSLRESIREFFSTHDAEFSVRVQLNTDLDKMSIENGESVWSQEESPYLEVGRLVFPPQTGWSPALDGYAENFSFNPANTLEAHRPLGSIARARLVVYKALSDLRHQQNGAATTHVTSTDQVPA